MTDAISKDTQSESKTLEATISLMPFLGGTESDERKAKYLAYRYAGFSFKEAVELTGLSERTVLRWRDPDRRVGGREPGTQYDEAFAKLESEVTTESRSQIRREVVQNLFTRNIVLILEHDYSVLRRVRGLEAALDEDGNPVMNGKGKPVVAEPSKQDWTYLNRIRGNYGPQQMAAMEKLAETGPGDADFNFTNIVMQMNLESRDHVPLPAPVVEDLQENGIIDG